MIRETPRRPGQGGGGGTSSGLVNQGERTAAANVVTLRSRALDRAEDRGRLAVDVLATQARAALDACLAGDVDQLFTAHWSIIRAVSVAMSHGLSTPRDPRPGA